MAEPELFNDTFYAWLEANGVTFSEPLGEPPFSVTMDLNKLKVGVIELINYYYGDTEDVGGD